MCFFSHPILFLHLLELIANLNLGCIFPFFYTLTTFVCIDKQYLILLGITLHPLNFFIQHYGLQIRLLLFNIAIVYVPLCIVFHYVHM